LRAVQRPSGVQIDGAPLTLPTTSPISQAVSAPDRSEPGVAGRSARREYERRRHAREQKARRRLGALGVGVVRLAGDPQHVASWKKGDAGEVRAAKRLERHLGGLGVLLMHDRRIPGSRANIDHIAAGPGGVTVIDSKNYKGTVRVERRGGLFSARRTELRVGGRDRSKLVEGVLWQIEHVKAALCDAGMHEIGVEGALCFVNGEELPLFRHLSMSGVTIDGTRHVAKVAARPGTLSGERVEATYRELVERLPPA
jgi:hypothetical protein